MRSEGFAPDDVRFIYPESIERAISGDTTPLPIAPKPKKTIWRKIISIFKFILPW